jgi:cytochrome c-type biogenesis protein CcmH/NrfG
MIEQQRPRDAVAALQQVAQIDPSNVATLPALGRRHRRLGDKAQSIEAYRRALALDTTNAEAIGQLTSLNAQSD